MQPTSDDRVPVLITGGSLVGLSTSLFLGRLGVDHLLVEKHAATSHHPRGRGNNVRTMELFRTAGIEPAIRSAASVLSRNHGILQAESLTGDNQRWLFREIDPGGGRPTVLHPFTKEAVPVVDIAGGRVVIAPQTEAPEDPASE